ncbi:hypothetical protein ABIF68_007840 [Bradyrhizobium japonicum]
MMTPLEVARAWHSVKDEWWVRRNGAYDRRQWEVVHHWGGNLISDDTMKVISRHETKDGADRKAERLEDSARGAAVLAALTRSP